MRHLAGSAAPHFRTASLHSEPSSSHNSGAVAEVVSFHARSHHRGAHHLHLSFVFATSPPRKTPSFTRQIPTLFNYFRPFASPPER